MVNLPGGLNASLRKTDWNAIDENQNWYSTNEAINLPAALEMSVPSAGNYYPIPVTRQLKEHPAASWSGLNYGLSYDGAQAVRHRVLGQWNNWNDGNTNAQLGHSIREVSTNRMIRVQYVTASGAPVPFRWLGYGKYEYGDPNQ